MSYSTQGDNSLIPFVQQIGLFLKGLPAIALAQARRAGDILEEFHLIKPAKYVTIFANRSTKGGRITSQATITRLAS
jgi:hypothetical protein